MGEKMIHIISGVSEKLYELIKRACEKENKTRRAWVTEKLEKAAKKTLGIKEG